MKENGDAQYWSEKFKNREELLMEPEGFLLKNINCLKRGSLLDIACGDGRNSVYLAKEGFKVTGVDFSEEALKRLAKFSAINHVEIDRHLINLDDLHRLKGLKKFDNIIMIHYKPTKDLFNILPMLLNAGGILLLCTFNHRQHAEKGFPRHYCLEENEFIGSSPELQLIKHEVFMDKWGHLDGYIFKHKREIDVKN